MNDVIKVYEHETRYYISGFDYVKLMNVDMGIDSQMGYFLIDSNILEAMRKGNYQIVEEKMQDYQVIKIQQGYSDKYGDTLKRMKMFSYDDLLLWRKNLDKYRNLEDFDPKVYSMLEEEIHLREEKMDFKDGLLQKMLLFLDELKEQYGEEMINDCVKRIPNEWEKHVESSKVHK